MRWHLAIERVLGSRQGRAWVCHGVVSLLPVNSFLLTRLSMGRYMQTCNSIQYAQTTKRGGGLAMVKCEQSIKTEKHKW